MSAFLSSSAARSGLRRIIAATMALTVACGVAAAQVDVTPAFTYQAQLKSAGVPVDGTADLQFRLFDAVTLGNQVGTTQTVLNADVVDGLFTTQLNFGAGALNGQARWLEIGVRSPAGAGGYPTLSPRQPLTIAPYAQYAVIAENGGVLTTTPNATPGLMWTRSPNNTEVFLSSDTNAGLGFSSTVASAGSESRIPTLNRAAATRSMVRRHGV